MIAVIVTLCVVLTIVFAVASHGLTKLVRAARAERDAAIEQGAKRADDERARADLVIAHERERHTAEIERMQRMHEQAVDRLLHMVNYGSPVERKAEVTDKEPDAEERLQAGISEDAIRVGALRIQQMYEGIGQVVSLEECMEEARSMAYGLTPQIPDERMGRGIFLRDGPALVREPEATGATDGAS